MLFKKSCHLAAHGLLKCKEKNCYGSGKKVVSAKDQASEI